MRQALLWGVLGYLSCVWDCSTSPFDPRWPSATGAFMSVLAMREPKYGLWGAALCGLVLDAANGGAIGPRALSGVIAFGLATSLEIGRAGASWLRTASITSVALAIWLATPVLLTSLPQLDTGANATSVATKAATTLLIVTAIHSLIRPQLQLND